MFGHRINAFEIIIRAIIDCGLTGRLWNDCLWNDCLWNNRLWYQSCLILQYPGV